jgi:hypothetical protein
VSNGEKLTLFREIRVPTEKAGHVTENILQSGIRGDQGTLRIALCDLACQGIATVRSHAENGITIGGRHGVVFSSAFFVKTPLVPKEIIRVDTARELDFRPRLSLDDFLKGRISAHSARRWAKEV